MKASNRLYQIMAVLIALLLWVYVVAEENIFQERTITVDVKYENLDPTLIPGTNMPTINIRIRGDQTFVNNVRPSDFQAVIDLSGARIGESDYLVKVNSPLGIRVVSLSPERVYLSIDEKAEKQIPLRVNVQGTAQEGFSSFEPSLRTSHVTVSGPKTMVQEVDFAVVDVNLDNASTNLSLKLPPRIRSGIDAVQADMLTINPDLVDVFIPIIEDNPSKSVPITVPITGIPAYGYKVGRIVVTPDIVRISGANEIIEGIREVQTKPVDITNASEDLTREVELNLPPQITSLLEDKIRVLVIMEKIIVEKRIEKTLLIKNAPEGVRLRADTDRVVVVLRGEELAFRDFLVENLEVFVDAINFSALNREFAVRTNKPANIEVVELRPERVTLTRME